MTTDVELLIINYWCWYCIVDVDIELKKTFQTNLSNPPLESQLKSNELKQSSLRSQTNSNDPLLGSQTNSDNPPMRPQNTQTILPW